MKKTDFSYTVVVCSYAMCDNIMHNSIGGGELDCPTEQSGTAVTNDYSVRQSGPLEIHATNRTRRSAGSANLRSPE